MAGLVGAIAAAAVHLHALAEFSFGIGVLSWLLLGFIFGRLFFRPALPAALVPTLALLIAPPAVAGVAYFFLSHGATGPIGEGLAGYTVLTAMAQLRLIPLYARLRFSVATWTFTFSYAAAATDAILWIAAKSPPGAAAWTAAVTALISLFIAVIAARTVIALGRRQLLPHLPRGCQVIRCPGTQTRQTRPMAAAVRRPGGRWLRRAVRADENAGKLAEQRRADRMRGGLLASRGGREPASGVQRRLVGARRTAHAACGACRRRSGKANVEPEVPEPEIEHLDPPRCPRSSRVYSVLATVGGWLAPARDSCPLPGHLGHSGVAVCCVSLG